MVLLDEFYTKIDWNDTVNLFNNTLYNIELKQKGFEPFLAKYIFLTARKPPKEAYNFGRTRNDEESTQQDWGQFEWCLDYIIEFTGK